MNKKDFVKAKKHISMSPGEMLRVLRELQFLSQRELADLTGIAQSNISALETGAREMGRERAVILAKALKVHPSVILFSDFDMDEIAA